MRYELDFTSKTPTLQAVCLLGVRGGVRRSYVDTRCEMAQSPLARILDYDGRHTVVEDQFRASIGGCGRGYRDRFTAAEWCRIEVSQSVADILR